MRYQQHVAGKDGWSDWTQPHHAKYKLRCCDCGLVHEMQFRIVRNVRGSKLVSITDRVPGLVIFKARRDNRATAAIRRKR